MNDCVFTCTGKDCPRWVVLTQTMADGSTKENGRCADAWMPLLMVELRQAIDNIDKKISSIMDKSLNI